MAPSKFEKHIKKILQKREIRPSVNAWDRISERLEVSEKPKSKRFYKFGIAAGFIGLLLTSIVYFNTQESSGVPQTVQEEVREHPVRIKQASEVINEKIIKDRAVVKEELPPKETVEMVSLPNLVKPTTTPNVFLKKPNGVVEKGNITINTPEELIDVKIAEIIAEVDVLEKENTLVTDAEIDALLRKAQQEIIENKISGEDHSVDATALLADVEDELDKSFRDQIFDALKDGFVKVRTAVADRNK